MNTSSFTEAGLPLLCDQLAQKDADLRSLLNMYGYPPFFSRTASFATLIHIILEQQVSLASAKAAFLKLQEKIGHITPEKMAALTPEDLKACYFSRQKIIYAKELANALVQNQFTVDQLVTLPDEVIRATLKKIKGIGDWTADVFLMMALHRCDCFPTGDIALLKSMKEIKNLPLQTPKETILLIADNWKPYRTVGAFMLWHAYISKRNIKL